MKCFNTDDERFFGYGHEGDFDAVVIDAVHSRDEEVLFTYLVLSPDTCPFYCSDSPEDCQAQAETIPEVHFQVHGVTKGRGFHQ